MKEITPALGRALWSYCAELRVKLDLGAEPRIYPLIRGNLYVCLTKLPRNFETKARRGHVEL